MQDRRPIPAGSQPIFDDTTVVAFLKLKDNEVTAQFNPKKKPPIEFRIEGDPKKIQEDLKAFHHNELVGITDYVTALKKVKSYMYDMKEAMKKEKDDG